MLRLIMICFVVNNANYIKQYKESNRKNYMSK
jgi:hypothetical protein